MSKMQYIDTTSPGGPEVLVVREREVPTPSPQEVLIEVKAAGVNRPDLSQRAGKYPPPPGASPFLGLEVAGVVAQAGAESTYKIGDKVCALVPGGGYAEYCLAPASHCLPIPKNISYVEAAGFPETHFTVWANVFQMAKLKPGERFLVHGGTSGIGTTAIQLAKAFGAEVFATAGSKEKCEACLELGATHAIPYKDIAFESEVARLTNQQGVNVILDMVGGDYTERNIQSLATDGRLVQIAFQRGANATINLARLMQKRAWITGSMLRPRTIAEKAGIAAELKEKVLPLLESGKVKVNVDRTFMFKEVGEAHRYLEKGEHIGKVIIIVRG